MKKRSIVCLLIILMTAMPLVMVAGEQENEPIESEMDFESFLQQYTNSLFGVISADVLTHAFKDLTPDPRVIEKDRKQPETLWPIWQYMNTLLSEPRIDTGKRKLAQHRRILDQVQYRYQIPSQYIVAIWGIESSYGQAPMPYQVIRSLATLSWTGRRTDFFKTELTAALKILDAGHIDLPDMYGSWAGAMGHTQFMPSSFLEYAIDMNKDNRKDIWHTLPDVFASTANYLKSNGWRTGEKWGREVLVPPSFSWDLSGEKTVLPIAEWSAMGVLTARGNPLPTSDMSASLIAPAGHLGPKFLIYKNFQIIKTYNNNIKYALAVVVLADRIAGRSGIITPWPVSIKAITNIEDAMALQTLLKEKGIYNGAIDGLIGSKTRHAIAIFQKEIGLPPDGFATIELLTRLRQ